MNVLSDAHLRHGSVPARAWPSIMVIAIEPQRHLRQDRIILLPAERSSVLNVVRQRGASGP
jgi:hypothetical protein